MDKNLEFYLFVQGADFPSVHRAGVQGLRGGVHSAGQPIQWLQRPRDPGTQITKAGPDLVVLRDALFGTGQRVVVQNLKKSMIIFFLLLLLWNMMAAGCCEGTYNPFTTFISDYSDYLCYCFSLYADFVGS